MHSIFYYQKVIGTIKMLIARTLFLIGAMLVHQSEGSPDILAVIKDTYNALPSTKDVISTLGNLPKTLGISGNPKKALIDQKSVDRIVAQLQDAAKTNIPVAKEKLYQYYQYLGQIAKSKVPIAKESIKKLTDYLADSFVKILPDAKKRM